jgi:hypothetical protein
MREDIWTNGGICNIPWHGKQLDRTLLLLLRSIFAV